MNRWIIACLSGLLAFFLGIAAGVVLPRAPTPEQVQRAVIADDFRQGLTTP